MLYSRTGMAAKGDSVRLAQQLHRDLSPEGWTSVRQGMWAKLTDAGEGKIEMGPQKLSQRLHEFLNGSGSDLAKVLFTDAERTAMANYARVVKMTIPVPGTTNPSGTAPALAKIVQKMGTNILAMLGAVHSGWGGAAVGFGLEKAGRRIADAKGGRAAVRAFYGDQPRVPAGTSRVPIVLTGAVPAQVE